MSMFIYDLEVFKADWIVIFKNVANGEYTIIHNDNEAVKQFMANGPLLGGFNNKWYDNHILKAILADADNSTVKEINDFIIGGGNGWEHSWLSQQRGIWFNSFDLFDDVQQGLSLKAIEAHLGLPIEESEVDFNIDRPLTPEELQQTVDYCKYDVDVTEKLLTIRKDYLQGKLALARMGDIPEERALYSTNAKAVALFLGATKQDRDDERQYKIPENLRLEFIPQEVKDFFGKMSDMKIPDDVLFKSKLNIHIGNCPTKYGFGGVHGSLTGYFEQATETRSIQNRDVGSMYPTIMIQYGYASRNIPSFDIYKDVYERRMKAKQDGDKAVDRTLKLVLNTKFGCMGSKYNDLYDPLMCRSVCITGQLFLTSLAVELYENCPSLKLLNLNTDGIMYSVDNSELPKIEEICKAWEENSRMSLETDDIDRVWIKDVNNLMFIDKSGSIKKAGGYLNHGISVKGAWNINNNHTIVKDAVVEFFSKGTPVEETIGNCNDPLAFQIIAKASGLYSGAFHIIDGEKVPVQKCNRVYATKNIRYGTLIKTHATRKTDAKIGGLPEHCIIDNNNEISISDIDKDWYIKLAKKYINDYLGIKPPKKNTRKINSLKKQILKILED